MSGPRNGATRTGSEPSASKTRPAQRPYVNRPPREHLELADDDLSFPMPLTLLSSFSPIVWRSLPWDRSIAPRWNTTVNKRCRRSCPPDRHELLGPTE